MGTEETTSVNEELEALPTPRGKIPTEWIIGLAITRIVKLSGTIPTSGNQLNVSITDRDATIVSAVECLHYLIKPIHDEKYLKEQEIYDKDRKEIKKQIKEINDGSATTKAKEEQISQLRRDRGDRVDSVAAVSYKQFGAIQELLQRQGLSFPKQDYDEE
jgi:hypothetical protein